jgi:hypothetical protein
MPDFTTKLELISRRGTTVGAEELIERIEAQLAEDPLVVVTQRRKGSLMTKTDRSVTTKSPGPGRGFAWALVAFAAILAVGGLYLAFGGEEGQVVDQVTVPQTTTPTPTVSAVESPIDTSTWRAYESERYGFTIGYPADWTVEAASHDWTMAEDAREWQSTGQEVFRPPTEDVRVSAWLADTGPTAETTAGVQGWIDDYCAASLSCSYDPDRVVRLCNEKWDCHPGLLVPFSTEVQAFFTGGEFGDRMIVVSVWRPERHESVAPYGGARQLLEAYLFTMDVCPTSDDVPAGCSQGPWQPASE